MEKIQLVLAAIGAALPLAVFIVKLTPSKKDDEYLGKFQSFYNGVLESLKKK